MKDSPSRLFSTRFNRLQSSGFSLVETAMSIALVTFGLAGLLGLLPAGLNNYRDSINKNAVVAALQNARSEIERTNFSSVTDVAPGSKPNSTDSTITLFFDEQGLLTSSTTGIAAAGQTTHSGANFFMATITPLNIDPMGFGTSTSPSSLRLWTVHLSWVGDTTQKGIDYPLCQANMGVLNQ